MRVPVEYYAAIEGSMTSEDGQVFLLKVRHENGNEIFLGFPSGEIPSLVEHMAMQSAYARDEAGTRVPIVFETSSFALKRNPDGDAVLGLEVGTPGSINFLLKGDMPEQLMDLLAQFVAHYKLKARHH